MIALRAILGGIMNDTRLKAEVLHQSGSFQSRKPRRALVSSFVIAPLRILLE